MPVAQITDHLASGLALLIDQYKGKPRLANLLKSYLNRVQELEDAAWDVLISRLIDTAEDAQLDTLGAIVGETRTSTDDDVYRTRIRTRILANRSLGFPEDLIAVATQGFDNAAVVSLLEYYPATTLIDMIGPVDADIASIVFDFLEIARAAGTTLTLHFSSDLEEDTFAFSSDDDPEDDLDRGFGGDDPTTGDGGLWIGAF